nr:hypothetical protein CFP56_19415 [Quercus suber]
MVHNSVWHGMEGARMRPKVVDGAGRADGGPDGQTAGSEGQVGMAGSRRSTCIGEVRLVPKISEMLGRGEDKGDGRGRELGHGNAKAERVAAEGALGRMDGWRGRRRRRRRR